MCVVMGVGEQLLPGSSGRWVLVRARVSADRGSGKREGIQS